MRFNGAAAGILAGVALLVSGLRFLQVDVCLFHSLTGKPCPLCGLTRGILALAHGKVLAAEHFNALTPLAAAMLLSLPWDGVWRSRLWRYGLAMFAVYGAIRLTGA